jgi:hypothetical protein
MFYLKLSRAIENAELDHGISRFDSISKEILKRVASTDETTGLLIMKDLSDLGTFPTIQAHLNELIAQGWIERHGSEKDRRIVNLSIAPTARQSLNAISEGLLDWYRAIGGRLTSFIVHTYASVGLLEILPVLI